MYEDSSQMSCDKSNADKVTSGRASKPVSCATENFSCILLYDHHLLPQSGSLFQPDLQAQRSKLIVDTASERSNHKTLAFKYRPLLIQPISVWVRMKQGSSPCFVFPKACPLEVILHVCHILLVIAKSDDAFVTSAMSDIASQALLKERRTRD